MKTSLQLACSVLTFLLPMTLAQGQAYSWSNFAGKPGGAGNADGTGSAARFNFPSGVAVDGNGNVYVADRENQTIRKITSYGVVTTLAGLAGSADYVDGTGIDARFYSPSGVAVDGSGNVYVAETGNHTIRKISSAGVVTTLAGLARSSGSADGTGSDARFNFPSGVAVDGSGNVYVADKDNQTIRKITSSGVVTTLAGTARSSGSADGTGSAARFNFPSGVAVDGNGNVYVADRENQTIRKITSYGVVTTLAGMARSSGSADGAGIDARFNFPSGLAVDGSGNVYVPDTGNQTIRKITSSGVVTTLAGLAGSADYADGTGIDARFYEPSGVAVDGSGNVYVAETQNQTIRKITSSGVVTTLAGMAENSGYADGTGSDARFTFPSDVAVDGSGSIYVADTSNQTIRKITSFGGVTTLAGMAENSGYADGTGSAARFENPSGVAVDGSGNVYVADLGNHTIRKITSAGVVTTLAGMARSSGSADGTGIDARFYFPSGVAVDGSGNVYVADKGNHTIRKITSSGVVTTLAGLARSSGSADGTGIDARFDEPSGVAVDGSGNVYVTETQNQTIRMITSFGVVTTLAGLAGSAGYADGTGSDARFNTPSDVAVDGSGNVYVADYINQTIRKITSAGVVTTIGGTAGVQGHADGLGAAAAFSYPSSIAVTSNGTLYVADYANQRMSQGIVVLGPTLSSPTVTSISATGAVLGGRVTDVGGSPITERGVVYSATASHSDPLLNGAGVTKIISMGTAGVFTVAVAGLLPNTVYSFKAYATNSQGASYTSVATFTTLETNAPVISFQPLNQNVSAGSTAFFSVIASGTSLTYQWRRNGLDLSKQTGAMLMLSNVQKSNEGVYDVVVKNSFGVVLSNPAWLTLPKPLSINEQPADVTASPGNFASFAVTAIGQGTLTYQWHKDGKPIKGAKSSTLNVPVTDPTAAGAYTVTVSSGSLKVTSAPAYLRVPEAGLLIYKFTVTGNSYEGTSSSKIALSGLLVLDRLNQRGGIIKFGKNGKLATFLTLVNDGLRTDSTGPVANSQTVVSNVVKAEESPEQETTTLWLRGTDGLVTFSSADKTMAPKTLSGFQTELRLAGYTQVTSLSLKATLDNAASLQARQAGETVEQTLNRLAAGLQQKGFIRE